MVTHAKKLMKTKVQSLRNEWQQWNSKLNTWFFPSYKKAWQTSVLGCTEVHFRYGSLLCVMGNLEPPPSQAFFLLYLFNTDVNVFIQNTPTSSKHHHMILWWCHAFILVGIHVHAPGTLSRGSCSQHGHCRQTCTSTFCGVRNGNPRCIPWHSPPGTSACPSIKPAR